MSATPPAAHSNLTSPLERFLSLLLQHLLQIGLLSYEEVVDLFTPERIMKALSHNAKRRADVLKECSGYAHAAGLVLPASAAGEVLRAALEGGVTSKQAIVKALTTDDLIHNFPHSESWSACNLHDWWTVDAPKHRQVIGELTDDLIEHNVLEKNTPLKLLLAMGIGVLASDHIPEVLRTALVTAVIKRAEGLSEEKKATVTLAKDALTLVAPKQLAAHLPMDVLSRIKLVIETEHTLIPPPQADEEVENRETIQPPPAAPTPALPVEPLPKGALALDEPGMPAPPGTPTADAPQASETDVEDGAEDDEPEVIQEEDQPSGPSSDDAPSDGDARASSGSDGDILVLEEDGVPKGSAISKGEVPISFPSDGVNVKAANKEAADQWNRKGPSEEQASGSGSQSGSSLKRQT